MNSMWLRAAGEKGTLHWKSTIYVSLRQSYVAGQPRISSSGKSLTPITAQRTCHYTDINYYILYSEIKCSVYHLEGVCFQTLPEWSHPIELFAPEDENAAISARSWLYIRSNRKWSLHFISSTHAQTISPNNVACALFRLVVKSDSQAYII